jgi:hypothetical protein
MGAYIFAGIFEFAATRALSTGLAPGTDIFTAVSLIVGLTTIVLGGYVAAWIRGPAAARTLAGIALIAVVVLLMTRSDSTPLWYGLTFLVGGPLASLAGGTLCFKCGTGRVAGPL